MNMLTLVNIGNPEREGTSRCFISTFGLPQFCSPSSCNDGTNQGPNAVWLVESITLLLKYVCNLCSKYPHFNSTFLFSRGTKFINFQELYVWCNQFFQLNSTTNRGPRYYLDILAIDIFGKFVPMRNFKKTVLISFEYLLKISIFPKLHGCGSKNGPAMPISNLKLISS